MVQVHRRSIIFTYLPKNPLTERNRTNHTHFSKLLLNIFNDRLSVYEGTQSSHKNRNYKTPSRKLGIILVHNFNFIKSNTPPWVFVTFLKCISDTKSRNAAHIMTYKGVGRALKESRKLFTKVNFKGGCLLKVMTSECHSASCNYIERYLAANSVLLCQVCFKLTQKKNNKTLNDVKGVVLVPVLLTLGMYLPTGGANHS